MITSSERTKWCTLGMITFCLALIALSHLLVGGCGGGGSSGAPPTYSIYGTVSGDVTSGVTLELSGDKSATTTTDGSGNYKFNSLSDGSYTVTANMSGCEFSPNSHSAIVSGADVTGKNFSASTAVYSISGTVSGDVTGGVRVHLSGDAARMTTTAGDGSYVFEALANGTYAVAANLSGYIFAPLSHTNIVIAGSNVQSVDFGGAAGTTYSISGNVSGDATEGVTIVLDGNVHLTTVTDSSGDYIFDGLTNGNYTVWPEQENFIFSPVDRNPAITDSHVTGMDFAVTVRPGDWTISDLGMTLKRIAPGTFTMGSPGGEPDRMFYEGPEHLVTITRSFWMASTETTIDQFRKFLLAGGSTTGVDFDDIHAPINNDATFSLSGNEYGTNAEQPMIEISRGAAENFCAWLTARESALPVGYVFRLPTEAEWEYCARAGTTTNFSYGQDNTYASLGDYAWFMENAYNVPGNAHTQVVAQTLANPWGLYDMHGNVREWCHDWFSQTAYTPDAETDPTGPPSGTEAVVRSGSWLAPNYDCRSAFRGRQVPTETGNCDGFRIVLAPELP